ncbi:ZN862-like protein [Mya arenaria]|uniref:ZN862-like protein n=1 Tax=Mya arenaria TaxID=6604 RepID=A0ABY7FEY0_MYAAR|nr:ZN862-like protein [Mya arenaria]
MKKRKIHDFFHPVSSSTTSHNDQTGPAAGYGDNTPCSANTESSKTASQSVGGQTETPASEHSQSPDSSLSAPEPGRWTADETRKITDELFGSKTVHSLYNCSLKCDTLSKGEIKRLQPKKFCHNFINKKNWWLVFVEGEGMYCLVCKKHMMKHPQNSREVFSVTPGVRFKHDAINTHSGSKIHLDALTSDKFQKTSCFHQELLLKSELEYTHLEKAFSVAYFLMKEFIANRKFQPLLKFIESVSGDETLKYFRHQSEGAHQEIFQTIGDTIKTELVEHVNKSLAYGLLTDEVSDIAVYENLITFVQFYCAETKKVETKFLSCQNILQDFECANAVAIKSLLASEVGKLDQSTLTGFSSDGASVMTGKKGGVATLLRQENPSMVNIHCVCHRLALSCNDSNETLSYIKTVETLLRQFWQLFENSPKKMAAYLKVQLALKSLNLEGEKMAKVSSRLKKACRTRWLSLDAAVSAVRLDFEAILQTLSLLKENDAAAHGLFKKMRCLKFLGTIYILSDILPVLSELSRHFQQDALNFSAILPAVHQCKDKLQQIMENEEPLQKLAQDLDSFTNMCSDIKPDVKIANELQNLLKNYVAGLRNNIDRRFSDTSAVVAAYGVFDPTTLPRSDEVDFKTYGENQIALLADHFFTDDVKKEKLLAQWKGFKYHVHDILLPNMPGEVRSGKPKEQLQNMPEDGRSGKPKTHVKKLKTTPQTPTEWLLLQLLRSAGLRHFNPELVFVAEAAASLPVSNAWPERGASILKIVKTKQRNRLGSSMLEGLLQVAINGPTVEDSKPVIKRAVAKWLEKPRRKLGAPTPERLRCPVTVGVQTDTCMALDTVTPCREEIRAVLKEILVEGEGDYYSSSSSDEDSDMC